MELSPAMVGFIRSIGVVVLFSVVHFLTNAANLNDLLGGGTAAIVAGLALAFEHAHESGGGGALFGAVKAR